MQTDNNSQAERGNRPTFLAVSDLCVTKKTTGVRILEKITVRVRHDRGVTVILGIAGAGKTTLLRALGGRPLSRGFALSGAVSHPPAAAVEYVTCAPFPEGLTVRETLTVAALLRGNEAAADAVERALSEFSLDECKDCLVGSARRKGISSGELARVRIGCALVGDREIGPGAALLLDDPTGGLDSALAYHVVRLLTNLGRRRGIIFTARDCNLRSWRLLERSNAFVIVLGQCGRLTAAIPARAATAAVADDPHANSFASPGEFLMVAETGCLQGAPPATKDIYCKTSFLTDQAVSWGETPPTALGRRQRLGTSGSASDGRRPSVDAKSEAERAEKKVVIDNGCTNRVTEVGETATQCNGLRKTWNSAPPLPKTDEGSEVVTMKELPSHLSSPWVKVGSFRRCILCYVALFLRSFKSKFRQPGVWMPFVASQLLIPFFVIAFFRRTEWPQQRRAQGSSAASGVIASLHNALDQHHQWTRIFSTGVNGTQYLLDAVEKGVDGNGSEPLRRLFRTMDGGTAAVATCVANVAYARGELAAAGYPRPVAPNEPIRGAEATAVALLQTTDYTVRKRDWSMARRELQWTLSPSEKSLSQHEFWALLSGWIARDVLNPVASCLGFPAYPIDRWDNPAAPSGEGGGIEQADGVINGTADHGGSGSGGEEFGDWDDVGDWEWRRRRRRILQPAERVDAPESLVPGVLDLLLATEAPLAVPHNKSPSNQGEENALAHTSWVVQAVRTAVDDFIGSLLNVHRPRIERFLTNQQNFSGLRAVRSTVETTVAAAAEKITNATNVLTAYFLFVGAVSFSCFPSVTDLAGQDEKARFIDERENGFYSASTYLIADFVAQIPFHAMGAAAAAFPLKGNGRFAIKFLAALGITQSASTVGRALSCALPPGIAAVAMSIFLVTNLTTMGLVLKTYQLPTAARWLGNAGPAKWGFQALVTAEFCPGASSWGVENELLLFAAGSTDWSPAANLCKLWSFVFAAKVGLFLVMQTL